MHTIITTNKTNTRRTASSATASMRLRTPHYDCVQLADGLKVIVYVPGVDAAGVEITRRGPDLTVTARKSHFVRVNWTALHLERAQRDYELRLRLGNGLDYEAMNAELVDGVLTLTLPKKELNVAGVRRVA